MAKTISDLLQIAAGRLAREPSCQARFDCQRYLRIAAGAIDNNKYGSLSIRAELSKEGKEALKNSPKAAGSSRRAADTATKEKEE